MMPRMSAHAGPRSTQTRPGARVVAAYAHTLWDAALAAGPDPDVAQDLALSTRTLQRRLADAGMAFQAVLDNTRHELACHYLRHTAMPAAEVGHLLGFQDAPAFHRALKGWQGLGPGQYRSAFAAGS